MTSESTDDGPAGDPGPDQPVGEDADTQQPEPVGEQQLEPIDEPEPAPNAELAQEPDSTRAQILEYVSAVGAPTAVGAALLFYFGWVRAHAQAESLGYDISVAGLSNTDYLLRSVPVLFLPVLALIAVVLVLLRCHVRLAASLQGDDRTRTADRLLTALRFAPLWIPTLGLLTMIVFPVGQYVALPISLTLGLLAYLYAERLATSIGRAGRPGGLRRVLLVALLVMLLFWDIERMARAFGEGYADLIVNRPGQFAQVVVFSAEGLEITRPGVTESRIGGDDSAYRYRYDGLRLMNYSNERYFLLAGTGGLERPVVLVVPDLPSIRVEFVGRG